LRALEALRQLSRELQAAGLQEPQREALALLQGLLQIELTALYRENPSLSQEELERLREAASRRARREPLQYILGWVDFAGLRLRVGPGVLIPRPETELLLQHALALAPKDRPIEVAEPCSGSAALALALAKALPLAQVWATECSQEALGWARLNLRQLGLEQRVHLLHGDLLEPLRGMSFDLLLGNPPYVPTGKLRGLQPEVSLWEPRQALDGGPDGLDIIRRILREAPSVLRPGAWLLLELGGQQEAAALARKAGLRDIQLKEDLAGQVRFLLCRKPL
jgi:release factor glutamine methyltransferase